MWFVHPFHHDQLGHVDAATIRGRLGDFSKVIRQPAKYAARMAQAFTATDPSVSIRADQWEEMDDLGEEPYLHTDGVGTISRALGDLIWEALCEGRRESYRRNVPPSAVCVLFHCYPSLLTRRFTVPVSDSVLGYVVISICRVVMLTFPQASREWYASMNNWKG